MPTCIKHNQLYTIYEYCVYCGKPKETEENFTSTFEKQKKEVENEIRKQELRLAQRMRELSERLDKKPISIPTIFIEPENTLLKEDHYNLKKCIVCGEEHNGLQCPKTMVYSTMNNVNNEKCSCGWLGCNKCDPKGIS